MGHCFESSFGPLVNTTALDEEQTKSLIFDKAGKNNKENCREGNEQNSTLTHLLSGLYTILLSIIFLKSLRILIQTFIFLSLVKTNGSSLASMGRGNFFK